MWGSQTRNRNVSGLLTCGLWTCWSLVLEIRSMDWAGAWIQRCLRPDLWMRMIRGKHNYQGEKIDMWILWCAQLPGFWSPNGWSLAIRDAFRWFLSPDWYRICKIYVDMISSVIGREMVNRDIEMIMFAYLSGKWADSWDLQNRDELEKNLQYGL